MAILKETNPELTPREQAELSWEKEAAHLQVDHAEKVSQLNLEIRKLEVKWQQLWRIPLAVVLLPVKLVAALAVPISVVTKKDLPKEFWEFIRG